MVAVGVTTGDSDPFELLPFPLQEDRTMSPASDRSREKVDWTRMGIPYDELDPEVDKYSRRSIRGMWTGRGEWRAGSPVSISRRSGGAVRFLHGIQKRKMKLRLTEGPVLSVLIVEPRELPRFV